MASQRASQASATTEVTHRTSVVSQASELLEDSGNCRQSIHQVLNLLPLSDSLISEQQRLRVALDWARSFLSSGSDVHHENNDLIRTETEDLKSVAAESSSDQACELMKAAKSCWSDASKNSPGAPQNEEKENTEGGKMERSDGKTCKTFNSAFVVHTNYDLNCSVPAKANTAKPTSTSHLKIPAHLTVYEQYQLCVDQLHHLRRNKSIEKDKKSSENTAAQAQPASCLESNSSSTNPGMKKHLHELQSRRLSAENTEKTTSDTFQRNKNKNARETPAARNEAFKSRDDLNVNETPAAVRAESRSLCRDNTSAAHLGLDGNDEAFKVNSAEADDVDSQMERRRAALTDNPGNEGQQVSVKAHMTRTKDPRQRRLCENSNRTEGGNGGMLPRQQMRPQSAGANKYTGSVNTKTHTKGHTLEARVKHTAPCRGTHTRLQPARTHTRLPQPAGVPVRDWLFLPDEVWLSILSLLSLSDLCKVVPVCSRLHTLATDHTLFKSAHSSVNASYFPLASCTGRRLRIENSTLTERWLLCVGRRRPRSLSLYSCSSRSVTASGLEMFFTLCRQTVEEVSVTGCMGPGLHGDHILTLVGQLCDQVTGVDVSWSGATDRGVTALSDGRAGLTLTSVLLNGCHVTDDPLKKLVMKHKQSLCRLEVFGCQFLTATCLQAVYEMCPGLRHLNIGQLPKVNRLSLTLMTSHLKSLISLNVTGLKAVTDAMLDTLLQNCVALQSLTLSCCPGVTDLTLHNISKYTPCIRSIEVSGCKAITDVGVRSLALGCKRLQQLDLSSTGTGSRGITLLASCCSQHLQTVKLSFCHISLEDILELCRRCRRLRVLHLYGCAQLPTEREIRDANGAVKVSPLS